MNRNPIYVRFLMVIIVLVVLLAFLNRTTGRRPENAWLPSTYNPVGAGTFAFYQTLQDLNWPVERWREPLGRLAAYGPGNTLVITRSPVASQVHFSDEEIELLGDWTRRGNTLILLGALDQGEDMREMLREFGFSLPAEPPLNSLAGLLHPLDLGTGREITIPPAPGGGGTGALVLPPAAPLPVTYPAQARVLWEKDNQPYVIELPQGAGRVICVASAQVLSNAFLTQGDNLSIVLGLLAPGGHVPRHLFFEESHHGFSTIFAAARLLKHPGVRFGGMLAILGLLAFFGSSLIRFGPIRPLQREGGRSTLEFVDSIADLYERADLRNDMLGALFRETHQRVLYRLNLPPGAAHGLIASRLQLAHPQLPKWKKLAQRFDSRDYMNGLPPSGWLRVARDLIEIKSAMA
jgi:hypothetical protein